MRDVTELVDDQTLIDALKHAEDQLLAAFRSVVDLEWSTCGDWVFCAKGDQWTWKVYQEHTSAGPSWRATVTCRIVLIAASDMDNQKRRFFSDPVRSLRECVNNLREVWVMSGVSPEDCTVRAE